MRRQYWVFAGDNYYPGGGAYDFIGSFDSFDEAKVASKKSYKIGECRWVHIFDAETNEIILER